MNFIVSDSLATSADLKYQDHFDGLRAQRREHFRNAVWWKRRYQNWGGDLSLNWFRAEVRCHRAVSRELWAKGTN